MRYHYVFLAGSSLVLAAPIPAVPSNLNRPTSLLESYLASLPHAMNLEETWATMSEYQREMYEEKTGQEKVFSEEPNGSIPAIVESAILGGLSEEEREKLKQELEQKYRPNEGDRNRDFAIGIVETARKEMETIMATYPKHAPQPIWEPEPELPEDRISKDGNSAHWGPEPGVAEDRISKDNGYSHKHDHPKQSHSHHDGIAGNGHAEGEMHAAQPSGALPLNDLEREMRRACRHHWFSEECTVYGSQGTCKPVDGEKLCSW